MTRLTASFGLRLWWMIKSIDELVVEYSNAVAEY